MDRDELCDRFLDSVSYELYPFQEEALLAWFESEGGVLVLAPTGMGKTLIAEAAVFEALHSGQPLYYTTPLIALTDQKFREFQDRAEAWGFPREAIGLIATWIDLGAPYAALPEATATGVALFEDVRPVLETKCLVCHGGKFKQAGLDISTRESLLKGSDEHTDVVVVGDAAASLLIKKIRHEHAPGMPYQSDRLSDDDIAAVEA